MDDLPDTQSGIDVLPYDALAESSVLGSVIIDPSCMKSLDLLAEMFFLNRNKIIWECLTELYEQEKDIDFISISDRLKSKEKWKEVGGDVYLMRLISDCLTSLHVKTHSEIIKDKYYRRSAIATASELVRRIHANEDINKIYSDSIDQLVHNTIVKGGAVHIQKVMGDVYEFIEKRRENPSQIWGIKTGFIDIDSYLGGLQRGEVFMVAGEPGIGKSKLAQQGGLYMATNDHCGSIYSLEMSKLAVGVRLASMSSDVGTRLMKSGYIDGDAWAKVVSTIESISGSRLFMCDKAQITLAELRADLTRLKYQHNIEWFILDYLLLMGGFDSLSDTEKSGRFSSGIKAIAKDLDLAAWVINSTTKEAIDNYVAKMTDARGSGQVLFDADVIAIMKKTDIPQVIELTFTKGRDIDRGKSRVRLQAQIGVPIFLNMTDKEEEKEQEGYDYQWQGRY